MQRLTHHARAFLLSRPFKVALCGGTGVIVQTIVFELLAIYLQVVKASTADLIAAECGVLTAFFLNERFSFGDQVVHAGSKWTNRLFRFNVITLGSIFIQWLTVFTAEHASASTFAIHGAYVVGILLGFVWNYNGYRLIVWGQKLP